MSDKAILAAQLVDVRNVGQHKCIKLTLHVAAEQAGLVMAAFGWPTMVDPVPVAIARLNPVAGAARSAAGLSTADEKRETQGNPGGGHVTEHSLEPLDREEDALEELALKRPHKPVDPHKRLAQRAGILCNDPLFQAYVVAKHNVRMGAYDERGDLTAAFVRQFCKVESRSALIPNTEAGLRWDLLESAFVAWRDVPEYADA